ncbi:hypothetical protein LEP1GSC050_4126 [Leptospira broomii serovar Hurstbridge str. 5399]|uniref:PF13338 domain protein n=1 Tax=Leptospira broomii serovar Hurstbridge str. 5399 TaxID=1049789 RepID=T0GK04_9LEPT|nr:hypothetical protein [Leptospira broomii]EQA45698.1 hypothetical protein LEP1GSC050_4126 [Leptospira broomii serovar Hurstbridge str. 5399]TGM09679.1 hypothetical protein EHQ86_00250 [Leptospira yasudae]
MSLHTLKLHLKPGKVYRRSDLLSFSPSVDRELKQLVKEGFLRKVRTGLYSRPRLSKFGEVPAELPQLVEKYLKTKDFLLVDHNSLNGIGLGLTQLYNEFTVYNLKRHGRVELGGLKFNFKRRPGYPSATNSEFLVVEFMNERNALAENPVNLTERLQGAVNKLNKSRLKKYADNFGKVAVKKELNELLSKIP